MYSICLCGRRCTSKMKRFFHFTWEYATPQFLAARWHTMMSDVWIWPNSDIHTYESSTSIRFSGSEWGDVPLLNCMAETRVQPRSTSSFSSKPKNEWWVRRNLLFGLHLWLIIFPTFFASHSILITLPSHTQHLATKFWYHHKSPVNFISHQNIPLGNVLVQGNFLWHDFDCFVVDAVHQG